MNAKPIFVFVCLYMYDVSQKNKRGYNTCINLTREYGNREQGNMGILGRPELRHPLGEPA